MIESLSRLATAFKELGFVAAVASRRMRILRRDVVVENEPTYVPTPTLQHLLESDVSVKDSWYSLN